MSCPLCSVGVTFQCWGHPAVSGSLFSVPVTLQCPRSGTAPVPAWSRTARAEGSIEPEEHRSLSGRGSRHSELSVGITIIHCRSFGVTFGAPSLHQIFQAARNAGSRSGLCPVSPCSCRNPCWGGASLFPEKWQELETALGASTVAPVPCVAALSPPWQRARAWCCPFPSLWDVCAAPESPSRSGIQG